MLCKAYIHVFLLFIWWIWLDYYFWWRLYVGFGFIVLLIFYFLYEEIRDIRKKRKAKEVISRSL